MSSAATTPAMAVLGLGSNLGDSVDTVRRAAHVMGDWGQGGRLSSLYSAPPLGPPQPDYVNGAFVLEFAGTPRELLALALDLEQRFGRERRERWGPRTLDVDVLWMDGVIVDEPTLTVPHAELCRRAFALVPLVELVPDARHPRTGQLLSECLASLDTSQMRPL